MIKYYGGKGWIGKLLNDYLPNDLPTTFIDVFVGGGNVVDKVYKHFPKCIINDIDKNLINFYEVIKNGNIDLICKYFEEKRASTSFDDLKIFREKLSEEVDDKMYYAYMYFAMNQCGFSGKCYDTGTRDNYESFLTKDIRHYLMPIKDCLQYCEIHNKDYRDVIYSGCMYYFDPPYAEVGQRNYYGYRGHNHSQFDHTEFRDFVNSIAKENFVLISYEDSPFIRELYKDYNIVKVDKKSVFYSKSDKMGKSKETNEVLIFNYTPVCASYVSEQLF